MPLLPDNKLIHPFVLATLQAQPSDVVTETSPVEVPALWLPLEGEMAKLQGVYRTDADPGLHAASEWLLRTWKEEAWLKKVNEEWAERRFDWASRPGSRTSGMTHV
jgi:hypothetical protein